MAYIPPSPDAPQGLALRLGLLGHLNCSQSAVHSGYAVTGGQDSVINIYDIASGREEPDLSLIGHTQNVCALQVGEDGTLVSGSWDRYVLRCSVSLHNPFTNCSGSTAKVWKNFKEVYELKGHHQAVWAVMPLSEDRYITGEPIRMHVRFQKS